MTTYKKIARYLRTESYRTIGQALKKDPYAPEVPCYRAIASNGSVGGYKSHWNNREKISLLEREGVRVANGKIDLSEYLYNLEWVFI